jgi:hypothetical protein
MKRVFPAFWIGALSVVLIVEVAAIRSLPHMALILIPIAMLAFGRVAFRFFLWDLADQVDLGGDQLIVRKGIIEARISLREVMNVDMSRFTNPRRLGLRPRRAGPLGDEIAFIPRAQFQFNPFARNAVAESLILRVDRLRQGS